MKKGFILVAVSVILISSSSIYGGIVTYTGIGGGGQISLVIPEVEDVAFGFGFHGIAEFQIGRFGAIQYNPSFTLWFAADHWTTASIDFDEHYSQIILNIFDIKYIFPIMKPSFKPYAGISPFPCIVIYRYRLEREGEDLESRSDAHAGFNIFFGIDFPIRGTFVPFFEWRFTGTRVWAMRMTGGFTIRF